MTAVDIAVIGAALYFAGFGTGFVFRPDLVAQFGLQWTNPAGRTEVRCYYGAVSWALSGFLVYLLRTHEARAALTGVLFLAAAVFVTRVVGTVVDGGRREAYTRLAVPLEGLFVLVLALIRFLA